MKLASYRVNNKDSFGIVIDNGIIDLSDKLVPEITDLKTLLKAGVSGLQKIVTESQIDFLLEEVDFLPVIPNPEAVFCVGMNTKSHCAEVATVTGSDHTPQKPVFFLRTNRTLVGHTQALEKPNGSPLFDYEGEVAIIIGKEGRHIPIEDALSYVAGYACFNDASIRDYQLHSHTMISGKNFPRTGGFGPWLITPDELGDLNAVTLTTRLNGNVVQEMKLDDLIYSFEEIISYLSEFTEIYPGDVIVTGSPAGVSLFRKEHLWMQDGDICEVEISRIGTLTNTIADAEGSNRAPVTKDDEEAVLKEAFTYARNR